MNHDHPADDIRPEDLLGYHLGLCEDAERVAIERAVASQASLADARMRLAATLAPLDDDTPIIPPKTLVRDVLARVEREHPVLRLPTMTPAADVRDDVTRSSFSLRDLLSLAACLLLFVGIFVPGYRAARTTSQQTLCTSNLGAIGQGAAIYNESYGSPLPLVTAIPPGASWVPRDTGNRPRVSNSQNAFRLISGGYVPPSAFLCPGRDGDKPLSLQQTQQQDFPDPRNISYSTHIVTPSLLQRPLNPAMPFISDLTPLVDSDRKLLPTDQVPQNSTSHGGRGQNVLNIGLNVRFSRTPNVGLDSDDIYRVIGVQQYNGTERPELRSDAFLVP
jgi:hypothetical protein